MSDSKCLCVCFGLCGMLHHGRSHKLWRHGMCMWVHGHAMSPQLVGQPMVQHTTQAKANP